MNERIRQLKEQSMEWVPNQVDPDTKIRLLNAEKFALLIVGECAMVAWQHTPDTEELEYSHLIKDKILANFGVKE